MNTSIKELSSGCFAVTFHDTDADAILLDSVEIETARMAVEDARKLQLQGSIEVIAVKILRDVWPGSSLRLRLAAVLVAMGQR